MECSSPFSACPLFTTLVALDVRSHDGGGEVLLGMVGGGCLEEVDKGVASCVSPSLLHVSAQLNNFKVSSFTCAMLWLCLGSALPV
jgi:hypothetical protein